MKNLLLSFILLLNFSSYSQTLVFDQIFIKAHDVDLYDSYLKDHFSKVMGERVDNGSLFAWDVWKVIQNPQEDYTHMLTFIYDFDKEETSWESPFSEIINDAVMKDISSIRDRVARTKLNNLAFIRKDGAPAVPGGSFCVAWRNYLKNVLQKGFMYRVSLKPSVVLYVAENKTLKGKDDRAYEGEALGRK